MWSGNQSFDDLCRRLNNRRKLYEVDVAATFAENGWVYPRAPDPPGLGSIIIITVVWKRK